MQFVVVLLEHCQDNLETTQNRCETFEHERKQFRAVEFIPTAAKLNLFLFFAHFFVDFR